MPPDEIKKFLDVVNDYAVNFHLKKIKNHHYGILEGYQATLSGAKSKMKNTQNTHNGTIFQFYMKVMTYLRRSGKEKIIFIRRQSEKINLNFFENLKIK